MLSGLAAGGDLYSISCFHATLISSRGGYCKWPVEIKDSDERGQITYSSGPFRGSEAFRDACRSTLTNQRLLTGATVRHTHISIFTPDLSLSLYFSFFLFLPLCLDACVSPPSAQCVFRRPSSHWSWRVSACTVIVSYRQSSLIISPLLCARVFFFFFFPLSVVGMLLFFHSCS